MLERIISSAILLLIVIDPFGNLPVFLNILKKLDGKSYKCAVLREGFFAFIILVGFIFGGEQILKTLHITVSSIEITGGIVLFIIALKMIFPSASDSQHFICDSDNPFIVPIAVPFIAGPSAIATVMLMSAQNDMPNSIWITIIATLLALLVALVILVFGYSVKKCLGAQVLKAIERLMGILLTCVSVEMIVKGVKAALNSNS